VSAAPGDPDGGSTKNRDASGGSEVPPGVDRAAALGAGAPAIPVKFFYWLLAAVLVLGLGGFLAEHLLSSAGLNPVATTTPTAVAAPPSIPSVPVPETDGRTVNAPLASFMGLSVLAPRPAPTFSLVDQDGRTTSIPVATPPSVVVLSFFNGACNDICPVVAAEIKKADADLGAAAAHVEFVTVNTDPTDLAQSGQVRAVQETGLGTLANWHMVTGTLATLNSLWRAYGVSISVDKRTGLESHNGVMDFIDPAGTLRERVTPFANESKNGAFSLPEASVARFGEGIATYAERLVTP